MPSPLQHILSNLEMAPPSGAWEQLASRLDTEYDPQEIKIAQKLSDAAIMPPAAAWTAIAFSLEVNTLQEQPAKLVRFPLRKLVAAAAAVIVVSSLVAWYFTGTTNNSAAPVINQEKPPTENMGAIQAPPATVPPADSTNDLPVYARASAGKPSNANIVQSSNEPEQPDQTDYLTKDIGYAKVNNIPNDMSPPAAVPVPPIRDASGKLVMDLLLLTSPGNNYVTVTGPNGEQTRISRKFLPMLTYLNGGIESGEYNNLWKKRFHEWRDKLLQQASFAPSATNFFDIMELKEMIEEK